MAHMESLWPRLAELPLVVESCEYDRLHAVLAHEFQRVMTHVRLVGAGADGLGEDVSVHVEDGARDAKRAGSSTSSRVRTATTRWAPRRPTRMRCPQPTLESRPSRAGRGTQAVCS
jgi:hypothetical protein